MGENNEKDTSSFFTHEQILEIELDLSKAVQLFTESPNPNEIKGNIQKYVIDFCLKRKYPLQETLDELNKKLPRNIHQRMEDIVPNSKRGKEQLVQTVLLSEFAKKYPTSDENKTQETVESFCNLTGISESIVMPIVDRFLKQRRKDIIEKDLYDFLNSIDEKDLSDEDKATQKNYVIGEFSEALGIDPKYTKRIIGAKKKREAKSELSSMTPINLDDNDDDAR